MKVYNVSLSYRHTDQKWDSGYLSGFPEYQKSEADILYHMDYYRNIDCAITEAKIFLVCDTCHGIGTVYIPKKKSKFMGKNVRCPECKGKDSEVLYKDFLVNDLTDCDVEEIHNQSTQEKYSL